VLEDLLRPRGRPVRPSGHVAVHSSKRIAVLAPARKSFSLRALWTNACLSERQRGSLVPRRRVDAPRAHRAGLFVWRGCRPSQTGGRSTTREWDQFDPASDGRVRRVRYRRLTWDQEWR
jgi:hypothetical protein